MKKRIHLELRNRTPSDVSIFINCWVMILIKLLVRVVLRGWTTLDVHASSWCLEWKVCGDFVTSLEPWILLSQCTYTQPISSAVLLIIFSQLSWDLLVMLCSETARAPCIQCINKGSGVRSHICNFVAPERALFLCILSAAKVACRQFMPLTLSHIHFQFNIHTCQSQWSLASSLTCCGTHFCELLCRRSDR